MSNCLTIYPNLQVINVFGAGEMLRGKLNQLGDSRQNPDNDDCNKKVKMSEFVFNN